MYMRGRRLRFTAVSAMVVLALTGFSSGRGDGSASHDSGGGAGCSSSSQDQDTSSTSDSGGSRNSAPSSSSSSSSSSGSSGSDGYDSGTSTGDSGTSTGDSGAGAWPTERPTPTASSSGDTSRPLKDGTAVLIHCASMDDPYATVEVRNPNGREGLFTMKIDFKDEHGFTIVDASRQVWVSAKDRATVRVAVAGTGRVDKIDHCEVDPRATADR
ncbi:hypothetical protein AB0E04_40050 [Streptomyces sp. NPDC048251]|uniref:hypothetical protein n=1 Tax=Streptomyces sp. NPDC048251 TaxID=3154501 RepID=UPI00341D158C